VLVRSSTSIAFVLAVAACSGSDPSVLTYDEFAAQAYYDPETNTHIVNGDELIENEDAMRDAYDSYLASVADAAEPGLSVLEQGLAVNRVGGRDDRWAAATASNITYCVSRTSFGTRHGTVVTAMNTATAAWEATARVNFVHNTGADGACTTATGGVIFNVRQVSGTGFLARAFFPSSSRAAREILIDASAFTGGRVFTLAGILRHELGHTLGFRHEHTRPEAGTCFENNSWRALTAYDAASVMHYPQCRGTNRGDLVLTALDRAGARALYP
jgi:serralysin